MAKLSQLDLLELNKTFEERTPAELIAWATGIFGDRLAALSAMQRAGNVLCHMLSKMEQKVPVLFVDTGVLFPETLATRDRIASEYGLEVVTLQPKQTMEEQTAQHGVLYLSVDGQTKCCHMRKTEPLLEVADRYDAFFGSLRRGDGGARANVPILAVDPETNSLRVNVMATMSSDDLGAYLAENDVIVNPLHAQGFPTIGCNRCTTPVMPDEPKRAGRWRHLGPWSQYCGINPTDLDPHHSPSIDLPLDLVDRILGRETDFVI